jgi:hypothetical protein
MIPLLGAAKPLAISISTKLITLSHSACPHLFITNGLIIFLMWVKKKREPLSNSSIYQSKLLEVVGDSGKQWWVVGMSEYFRALPKTISPNI